MTDYKLITFGDNIDTDLIISGKYLRSSDFDSWKDHVFEAIDPKIAPKLGPDHVIVGGHNFGCGSSREQATWAIKNTGVTAVIAKSFARIFFRNAINIGLKVFIAPNHKIKDDGGKITLDEKGGRIIYGKKEYAFEPYPDFINEIIRNGGLMNYFNNKKRA
ncbi:3-isopropylmalate dehydratase [Patescibacteria group bacterium]|nr:3-isopropylmalate dehydratase [Patescibacteria group bacterium]MBU1683079.1 3-isopropylmalate dehydratase [Patescibacteria group bacterium]MBU1935160.1 3-isopropylmalate dehydratase [Patescibacteria group bacterium]